MVKHKKLLRILSQFWTDFQDHLSWEHELCQYQVTHYCLFRNVLLLTNLIFFFPFSVSVKNTQHINFTIKQSAKYPRHKTKEEKVLGAEHGAGNCNTQLL